MKKISIEIWQERNQWMWAVSDPYDYDDSALAYGTSPDYHQACECARIAWEQHAKDEPCA